MHILGLQVGWVLRRGPRSCFSAELIGQTEQARHQTWAERLRWREVDNEDFADNVRREVQRISPSQCMTSIRVKQEAKQEHATLAVLQLELKHLKEENAARIKVVNEKLAKLGLYNGAMDEFPRNVWLS